MTFSERHGYKPVNKIIQIESMNEPLRNGLWSMLQIHCWDDVIFDPDFLGLEELNLNYPANNAIKNLCQQLWLNYLKEPLDQLNKNWPIACAHLRQYFFSCEWYEVYDFIEFIADNYERNRFKKQFMQACNELLEREMSAYRFVDGIVVRITEEHEVTEIEQAIEQARGPVSKHLHRSLELLSDRKTPDYRNSIKESISAVESLVAITVKAKKGTLGQLIKKLKDEIGLHPSLQEAFSSLYGYTSDEKGIRHALTEAGNSNDFNDAKFMLVVCSAFVNFVQGKMENAE